MEKLTQGYGLIEGPVWFENKLFFSDVLGGAGKYAEYGAEGLPTKNADGTEVAKGVRATTMNQNS